MIHILKIGIFTILASLAAVAGCTTGYEPIPDFTLVGAITSSEFQQEASEAELAITMAYETYKATNEKLKTLYDQERRLIQDINETAEKFQEEPSQLLALPVGCTLVELCTPRQRLRLKFRDLTEQRGELSEQIEQTKGQISTDRAMYYYHLVDGIRRGFIKVSDEQTYLENSTVQVTPFEVPENREAIVRFTSTHLVNGVEIEIRRGDEIAQRFSGADLFLTNGFSEPIDGEGSELSIALIDQREHTQSRTSLKHLLQEIIYIDLEAAVDRSNELPRGELNEAPNSTNQSVAGSVNEGLCGNDGDDDSRQPIESSVIGQVMMFNSSAGATPLGSAFRVKDGYVLSAGHVLSDHLGLLEKQGQDKQERQRGISYIQVWFKPTIDIILSPVNDSLPEHKFYIDPDSIDCSECALDSPGRREPRDQPGNDWAVFRLKPNVLTNLTVSETFPDEPGIEISALRSSIPNHNSFYVMGFGRAADPDVNLKMQIGAGSAFQEEINKKGLPWIRHRIDTQHGSSGGPLIDVESARDGSLARLGDTRPVISDVVSVGIHVGGFCELNSSVEDRRDNEATSFNSPDLREQLERRNLIAPKRSVASN